MQIEINGIKMEIDERYCKVIEQYKVGDSVKVLVKEYSDTYTSYPGTICGFNNFQSRPTIVVAYVKQSYSEVDLKFVEICKDTKDIEIAPATDDVIKFSKEKAIEMFDRMLAAKRLEVEALLSKKNHFIEMFGKAQGE